MKIDAKTVPEYINQLNDDRKEAITKLCKICNENLSSEFIETINYNMIGYVVNFDKFPEGYHCQPKKELPFINIASQKNYIAFYHLGLYASQELLNWFIEEYPKHTKHKLNMGKSCIRFRKMDDIPYHLLEELIRKMNADQWIELYLQNRR